MATSLYSTLDEIKTWLSAQKIGDQLDVNNSLFSAQMVNDLFEVLNQNSLSIKIGSIDVQNGSASVTGFGTLLTNQNTSITFTFSESDSLLILELDFTLDPSLSWTLIDQLKLSFTNIKGALKANTNLKVLSLSFSSVIEAGTSGNFKMPINMQVPSFDGDWILSGSFNGLGNLTKDVISAIGGNNDIISILPSNLQALDNLKLNDFQMSFNPIEKTCSLIKIVLACEKPGGWKFFSDKFIVDDIKFDFEVINPYNGALKKSFQAGLIADMTIGGAPIEVGGRFPEQCIFVQLQPDQVMHLTDVLKSFDVPLPEGFPKIDISTLSFIFYVPNNSFNFQIGITKSIPISGNVSLDNFYFQIQADHTPQGAIDASGVLNTQFSIGPTTIMLNGNYESSGVSTIYGEVDNLEVGHLIIDLTGKFGIDKSLIPTFIGDLILKKTTVLYSTDKTFKFYCEAVTQVANKKIDIFVNFTLSNTNSVYTIDFEGKLIVDKLEFDIVFDRSSKNTALLASQKDATKTIDIVSITNEIGGKPDGKDTILKATLSEKSGKALNISDFAAALGVTPPKLPEALNDIALIEAGFEYETKLGEKSFLFKADSKEYGNIIFVIVKTGVAPTASWKPFFGINFKHKLDFKKLPVVGSMISKFGTLCIEDIMLAGIPEVLVKDDIDAMNKLLQDPDNKDYPQLPAVTGDTIPAEVIFDATIDLNGDKQKLDPINIPLKKNIPPQENTDVHVAQLITCKEVSEEAGQGAVGSEVGTSSEQKVGKSFGPVTIQKFNISYSDDAIVIDVNGAMTMAGLEMSFEGLGMHMKFPPKNNSDVSFQLHGLGINLQKGDLRIAGGFIAAGPLSDPFDSLMGMIAINAGTIGLQAYGGYSTKHESFFIFLHLEIPIGGPPFFFVDGLSGGFGINRDFILPGFDELGTFPLLPAAPNNPIPSGPPAPGRDAKPSIDDITKVLLDLDKYIPQKEGAYWVAFGLDFTSFELLQVSAILEVSFGKDFQVGLLGNASMSIPEPEEPIAFISINFEVIFAASKGIFAALGEITPSSFLFSNACQLTGGFAFYTWFSGSEHEGDFVVTIGGYHPDFKPPTWYPAVPRLELKWDLGPLHIDGKTFFALTPHVLMAGLDVSATWSGGPVKAWFDMGIDFILGWKPFFYEAEAYIHLGASIHILFTITVHVGADINIWGPQFGGKATIDLDIISFTIHFGSKGPTPPPIPWSEFKKLMPNTFPEKSTPSPLNLAVASTEDAPKSFSVSTVTLSEGLLIEISKDPLQQDDLNNDKIFNWLIDPNHFQFHISSGVPSNNFKFNAIDAKEDKNLTPATGNGAYVLPCDLARFYSNPNNKQNPDDKETIFAYNYKGLDEAEYWWKQEIGVAPVDIASEDFKSTLQITLYKVGEAPKLQENNIVLTAVSNNAAKSLWGSQVTSSNGSGGLNAKPTIKNTLGGMMISAKIYHPLQTRSINLYDLIFQQGNQVNLESIAAPTIGTNSFDQTVSNNGDSMSFKDNQGNSVDSEYRELNTKTFAQLAVGESIIKDVNTALGLTGSDVLEVNTNAVTMAAPRYQDWPVLVLLGEEDKNAD